MSSEYSDLVNAGNSYAKKEEYDEAIDEYNKAIEIDPELMDGYNNRGLAYHNKGQYDKALSDLNKALEINPDYADAKKNREHVLKRKQ